MNSLNLTSLQTRALREIVSLVRRDRRCTGDHLTELELANQMGISRTPIQVALRHLAKSGLVQQDANRGYFLVGTEAQWERFAISLSAMPDDPLYLQMAQDRLKGVLPDELNEAEMMRRYKIARSTLRKILSRASAEGWAQQSVGQGWRFLGMINSPEAYEESYLFRQSIEPAGLLSPSFKVDAAVLETLRQEQKRIVDGGFEIMTAIELFEANSRFHESLAVWSGNRFIVQSVARINLQRRLVEYQQAASKAKRPLRQTQAQEHLAILDAISRLDMVQAASLMRNHLDGARKGKSHAPF